jgi:ribosome-associated protein
MRPVAIYTDFLVICTGRNPRQTQAIFDEVREQIKAEHRLLPQSVDGTRQGSWIVADYLDVVLHIFTPEARDYYQLEDLWGDAPVEQIEAVAS